MRDLKEDNDGASQVFTGSFTQAQVISSDNTAFDGWRGFRGCLNQVAWVP